MERTLGKKSLIMYRRTWFVASTWEPFTLIPKHVRVTPYIAYLYKWNTADRLQKQLPSFCANESCG